MYTNAAKTIQTDRTWLIAAAKASNAILEAIAADKIATWYARQGKRIHINWNLASDIATKQEFDLVDTLGVRWEVKHDKIARTTGRVFIEDSWINKSLAEMACLFVDPFAYILPRLTLINLESIGIAHGGDFNLARGHYISLEDLQTNSDEE
jgi:hypothetical protein